MTENDPFEHAREKPRFKMMEPKGPNVTSSVGRQPRPDALRVQRAAIRKHLDDRAPRDGEARDA